MVCQFSKFILIVSTLMLLTPTKAWEWEDVICKVQEYGTAAAIGGSVVVAAPFVAGAMGFGGAGIAAGSVAAKMMSASAIANGGGVVTGGVVSTLQSIGAAGLSVPIKAAVGSTVAAAYQFVAGGKCEKENCK